MKSRFSVLVENNFPGTLSTMSFPIRRRAQEDWKALQFAAYRRHGKTRKARIYPRR